MNKKEIEELKKNVERFKDKDIYIELQDAINFHTVIENAKIIVSSEKLFISNEEQKDFIVELHYLEEIEIMENTIYMEMNNDLNIIITY